MKKYIYLFLVGCASIAGTTAQGQTNYSFPISTVLNSMPTGVRLPNGTIVKAERVVTATGSHSVNSGTAGTVANMGGVFSGTTIATYVGNTAPASFTVIETANSSTLDGGNANNCQGSIGFRIYFDRPTVKISFLALDIDGNNTNPGNAEWVSAFAYNGNTVVPYTQTVSAATNLGNSNITTNTSWRTLVTNTISATAGTNLSTNLDVKRSLNGSAQPNDINNQVLYNPTNPADAITDFYILWGLWQTPPAATNQTSGLSPIVVRVSPDFGDLPDTYTTLLASAGPSHGVVGTLALGTLNNTKADGTPSALANTDPDDDGIVTVPVIANVAATSQIISTYALTTTYNNTTGLAANYVAWVDWNNNGVMDAAEGQTASTVAGSTSGSVTFTWTNVTLSGAGGLNNTYARIRVSTEAIPTSAPGGAYRDGEIEDYLVPFLVPLPLPLRLVSFNGAISDHHAVLHWKTADEVNTDRFEVQFSSDGMNFSGIGTLQAAGKGDHSYSFTDDRFVHEVNYYRLKMIDKDGTLSYSHVTKLVAGKSDMSVISIMPNPVSDKLALNISTATPLQAVIYNEAGQVIRSLDIPATRFYSIDCSGLSSGLYYIQVSGSNGLSDTKPFVKK